MTDRQRISGALNPLDSRALDYARKEYASFRSMTTDCIYISNNTGHSLEQVSMVKGYLFSNQHYSSYCNKFERFDPSYEIAQSWRRLMNKKGQGIQRHDMLLIPHELLEMQYIIMNKMSQQEAHELASRTYDYSSAVNLYYGVM